MRLCFDRGTLLLSEPLPELDLASLPGVLWDPRVSAYRAPACFYPALRAELLRRGVQFSDAVRQPGQAPLPLLPLELRPYQEAALTAWEMAKRRGLVVLPTGSGKTRVALAAMARTGLRTLCLVPTRALLDQWMHEIGKLYRGEVGCYGDGSYREAPLTMATFESAYRHMEHLGNRFDLLIVDEAHHFGAGVRDEALALCTAAARLGLTATPPRDGAALERLSNLLGPPVYELCIGDLAGRYLASFDLVVLHLLLTTSERLQYEEERAAFQAVHKPFYDQAPEASWLDFVRTCARTREGRRALSAFHAMQRILSFPMAKREAVSRLLLRHRDQRVLVFTADNQAAYEIAREHLIMPITCDISRRERELALRRFQEGTLSALVSARVLNEGVDVPEADVAIIVAGVLGEREHVQRIGRLLRPAPGKRALCYELVVRGTTEVGRSNRRRKGLAQRVPASL